MTTVRDVDQVQILRLHTDAAGNIWFGDDSTLGVNSGCPLDTFFDNSAMFLGFDVNSARSIRVLGSRQNAGLLVKLQELRSQDSGLLRRQRVELASPAVCPTYAVRSDPCSVLQHLWQPEPFSAFRILWHPMGRHDYCSYAMARDLDLNEGRITDRVRHIAKYHPAWPAVTFTPKGDLDSACIVLADILDARWFIHYQRPNRLSKLCAYMGVTPQNVKAFFGGCEPGRHYSRAVTAISAWYNRDSVVAYNTGRCDVPEAFLWRVYASQRGAERGVLRGTERLLSLISHVWLNAVMPPHPEVGFRPTQFFKYLPEAKAFERHYAANAKVERPGRNG